METFGLGQGGQVATRGLNRTMQYGNYASTILHASSIREFKSYYVVWKLPFNHRSFSVSAMFKSYYVVWKLPSSSKYRKNAHRFKSYYVVWKLPTAIKCICWWKRFKSYYVVWKQLFASASFMQVIKKFKSYYVVWKQKF